MNEDKKTGNIESDDVVYEQVGEIPSIGVDKFQHIEVVPRRTMRGKKFRGHGYDRSMSKIGWIHDGFAQEEPTSSFYLRKKDQGVYLPDGVYINSDQLVSVVFKYVKKQGERGIVVASSTTGKRLSHDTLVEIVTEVGEVGKFIVNNESLSNRTQDASFQAVGKNSGPNGAPSIEISPRLDFEFFRLKNGQYVSVKEFEKALSQYVLMKPKFNEKGAGAANKPAPDNVEPPVNPSPLITEEEIKPPIKPSPLPPEGEIEPPQDTIPTEDDIDKEKEPTGPEPSPEIVTATKTGKIQEDSKRIAAASLAFIPILIPVFEKKETKAPDTIESTAIVQGYDAEKRQLSEVESLVKTLNGLDLGEQIPVEEGLQYHESSDYNLGGKSDSGIVGVTTGREAGNYELTGVSIVEKGVGILDYSLDPGTNIGDFYSQVLSETGKTEEEIDVLLHIGGENQICGWVRADVLLEESIDANSIEEYMVPGSKYTVTTELEEDGVITFNNGREDIELKIVDEDGARLAEGTDIVGSDGETYQLLDVEDKVVEGEKTTKWQLSVPKTIAASALASAVATVAYHAVKKSREENDSKDDEFVLPTGVDDDYKNELNAFYTAKGEYDSSSGFHYMSENPIAPDMSISDDGYDISASTETLEGESLGGVKK